MELDLTGSSTTNDVKESTRVDLPANLEKLVILHKIKNQLKR